MVRLAISPPSKDTPRTPASKATARANSAEVSVAFCTDDYIQNVRPSISLTLSFAIAVICPL